MSQNNNILLNVPTTDVELRHLYLSGEKSILRNLSIPSVELQEQHSYVSLKECVKSFLAYGKMPESQPTTKQSCGKISCITQSIAATNIYKKAKAMHSNSTNDELIVLLGIQWSDDCDPNSSIKSNRGSIWVKTVTFISEDFGKNDNADTYLISIGLKGFDHDEIEKKYINEPIDLGSGNTELYFCIRLNKVVKIHFEIVCSLGDQPERRSINYI